MYRELGVPVGIIQGARGGTCISLWTSLAAHRSNPIWKAVLEDYEAGDHEELLTAIMIVQDALEEIRRWKSDCKKAAETGAVAPKLPRFSGSVWDSPRPGVLYDTLVAPLAPFAIRGVLWYQGESDAGQAEAYKIMLPSMIRGWRNAWHDNALPFVIAQIACTNGKPHQGPPKESAMAELRDAQLQTAATLPAGMIVTYDLVKPTDDIHYGDKIPVGNRMALAALGTFYGRQIDYSGPLYREAKIEGAKVRLSFDHLGGGLVVHGEKLGGFAIAGEDRQWTWADARIDGDTVVVESAAVPHPAAVRYAWTDTPCGANLFNRAGLPASGFRTDHWPYITKGAH